MKNIIKVSLLACALILTACGGGSTSGKKSEDNVTTVTKPDTSKPDASKPDTSSVAALSTVLKSSSAKNIANGKYFDAGFTRSLKLTTPNGGSIMIYAQNRISEQQLIRAKNVLSFYLTNYKTSKKEGVANAMAKNGATLLLMNGKDEGAEPPVSGQPLYEEEIQVEGGDWYIKQNYEHRDASYEEILHLVHDTGIGVDVNGKNNGAMPELQKKIRAAQVNALSKKIWTPNANTVAEWKNENSLSQEYLASLIDAYYGLWGAWKENVKKSMWGMYEPHDRVEIKSEDPEGQKVIDDDFFPPYITYNAQIDKNFNGTFSLKFDSSLPYTYHSRYLKDITLAGTNDVKVKVNELDNDITGNDGKNTVIFSGNHDDYDISRENGKVIVTDKKGRDGKNTLQKIQILKFADIVVSA